MMVNPSRTYNECTAVNTDWVHLTYAYIFIEILSLMRYGTAHLVVSHISSPGEEAQLAVAERTPIIAKVELTQARENFIRLAEARTTRVLKDLELLGNLSNRSNYSYGEEDVRKIFRAIQKRLRDTEGRFRTTLQLKADGQFRL